MPELKRAVTLFAEVGAQDEPAPEDVEARPYVALVEQLGARLVTTHERLARAAADLVEVEVS